MASAIARPSIAKGSRAETIALLALCALFVLPVADALPQARIIVSSESVSLTLAGGNFTSPTPLPSSWPLGTSVTLIGQVVDGDHVPLWQGGAQSNAAVDAPGTILRYRLDGGLWHQSRTLHAAAPRPAGAFLLPIDVPQQLGPSATLQVEFPGVRIGTAGALVQLYGAASSSLLLPVSAPVTIAVSPPPMLLAGTTTVLHGTVTTTAGAAIDSGVTATRDGIPLARPTGAGVAIDAMRLDAGGQVLLSEEFEGAALPPGWSISGSGTPWSVGSMATGSPPCPNGGCASVGAGAYDYATQGWLTSPLLDLSGALQGQLDFQLLADVGADDLLEVQWSNDDGATWPLSSVLPHQSHWMTLAVAIPDATPTQQFGTVAFLGEPQVRLRVHLLVRTLPYPVHDGAFAIPVSISPNSTAGMTTVRISHPSMEGLGAADLVLSPRVVVTPQLDLELPTAALRGGAVPLEVAVLDGTAAPVLGGPPLVISWKTAPTNPYVTVGTFPTPDGELRTVLYLSATHPLGITVIRVARAADEHGLSAVAETILRVRAAAAVEVRLDPPSPQAGEPVTILGSVWSAPPSGGSREPLVDRAVTLWIDGVQEAVATSDSSGQVRFALPATPAGLQQVRISLDPTPDYEGAQARLDLSGWVEPTLQVRTTVDATGQTLWVEGTLLAAGHPLTGQPLRIALPASTTSELSLDERGGFSGSLPLREGWRGSVIPLEVSFAGAAGVRPLGRTIEIGVPAHVQLAIEPMQGPFHRGAVVTLHGSATIPDLELSDVVTDHVRLEVVAAGIVVDVPIVSGRFSVALLIPLNATGFVPVTVALASHALLAAEPTGLDLLVVIPTRLSWSVSPSAAAPGAAAFGVVLLSDDRGVPLPGQTVRLVRAGAQQRDLLASGRTDDHGALRLDQPLAVPVGSSQVEAVFDGDGSYLGSEASTPMLVGPAAAQAGPPPLRPVTVAGLSLSASALVALVLAEPTKYLLAKMLLVPVFTRVKGESTLDHFVRGQIYGLVRLHPGVHYNLIKRNLRLTNGQLAHHLQTLEREGFIIAEWHGPFKRFFPNAVTYEYPLFLSALQKSIVSLLRDEPGLSQKALAQRLGSSTSTINDNIRALVEQDLVRLERSGKHSRCFVTD